MAPDETWPQQVDFMGAIVDELAGPYTDGRAAAVEFTLESANTKQVIESMADRLRTQRAAIRRLEEQVSTGEYKIPIFNFPSCEVTAEEFVRVAASSKSTLVLRDAPDDIDKGAWVEMRVVQGDTVENFMWLSVVEILTVKEGPPSLVSVRPLTDEEMTTKEQAEYRAFEAAEEAAVIVFRACGPIAGMVGDVPFTCAMELVFERVLGLAGWTPPDGRHRTEVTLELEVGS